MKKSHIVKSDGKYNLLIVADDKEVTACYVFETYPAALITAMVLEYPLCVRLAKASPV